MPHLRAPLKTRLEEPAPGRAGVSPADARVSRASSNVEARCFPNDASQVRMYQARRLIRRAGRPPYPGPLAAGAPFLRLLLVLLGLGGCQTAMTFSAPGDDWQTYQGQMQYTNPEKSVIGEIVARRAPGGSDFQLQFSSGPGIPLLKLWEAGDSARAEGLFARGSWQGRPAGAPARLKNWVALREVFARLSPGVTDLRGPGWTGTAAYAAGEPQRCEVTFAQGGERFVFQFSR